MPTNLDKITACLSFLGLRPNMWDYKWRFMTQKTAFLAKALGMTMPYSFTIYVSGPYSRELNCDYYPDENKTKMNNLETDYILIPSERVILERIKSCRNLYEDQQLMEATATIVYLMKENPGLSDDDLLIQIKRLKPHIRDIHRIIGMTRAKQLLFKEEYVTEEIKRETEEWDRIA